MSKPAEQLGLALNLESLIQIQSQLATEISRDIESPNDSKFHYAIPRMKNTLLSMEQCLHEDKRVVSKMITALNNVCRAGEVYHQQSIHFAQTLVEFGTETRTTDPHVGNGIVKVGQVMTQIGNLLQSQTTAIKHICTSSLEVLFENELKAGKYKSHVDSAVGQYEAAKQRIEREEREELRKKNIPNWKEKTFMPDELAGRLEQDRRNFQMRTLEYMAKMMDVRFKRGLEYADHLLQFMSSQHGYFSDCANLLDMLKQWENKFSVQLSEQRALHDEERKKLSALREKVKTAMGMGKNLDNRASMLPSVSSTDRTMKTGYLAMKPRGALAVLRFNSSSVNTVAGASTLHIFKTAKRKWVKVYCTANLSGFSIANSHTHAPHMQIPLMHYQCKDMPELDGRKFCFQLLTHTGMYTLDAETESELKDWKAVIHNCQIVTFTDGPQTEKAKRQKTFRREATVERGTSAENMYFRSVVKGIISTIQRLPGNNMCCDCGAADPEWLSVNLGVLICIECSGQHRDLSVQFSRIRSIKLDDLHSSELLVARVMGNQLFNEVMEATLPQGQKPAGNSSMAEKKDFIRSKYIDRKFVELSQTDADYTIQHELREAVNCRDIRHLLQTYAEGADMCAPLPDRSDFYNALHLAVEQEDLTSLHIVEFIASNSRAVECKDNRGHTPLHLAASISNYHCLQLLLTKRPDFAAMTDPGQTPLDIAEEEGNEECVQLIKEAKRGKFAKCGNIDIEWGVEDPEESEGLYCTPEEFASNRSISSPHIVLPRAKQDQNPLASSQSAIELLEHVLEKKGEEPVYSSIEDTCNSTPPATAKAQQSDLSAPFGKPSSQAKEEVTGPRKAAAVSSRQPPSSSSSPPPPPLPPRQAIVTAIYDCFPDHEDELAFKEGERIVVTKKHTLDWWEGYTEANPAVHGVFPSNYVES